ncbi:lipopolysaccharide kinase, WaaP family [Pseudomonas taetrolens]|nr:lipopolysaccharide kinase, WaaP family [Pseudomonas taetrolens]
MTDFLAAADRTLLERNGLADFDALWALQLEAVDEPNTSGGGWSSVFRLDLEGQGFYLKRQNNYLTRTLYSPLGEPSFAREFRNIQRYQQMGIPALDAVFFGERKAPGERRAILMTRALDGWNDLDSLLEQWPQLTAEQQQKILQACGQLARRLHAARQVHGCFYPKHIFLQPEGSGYRAQLIDLEKPGLCCWVSVTGSRISSPCCAGPGSGPRPRCAPCLPRIWSNRSTVAWLRRGFAA